MKHEAKILQLIPAPAGMSIVVECGDDVYDFPAVAIALVDEGGVQYLSALGMDENGETFSSTDQNFLALLFNGKHLRL